MITKICGIKSKSTLLCCEKNKVDFFGMIFFEDSPRNIKLQEAKELQELSKNMNIDGVGVFVNKNINDLEEIVKDLDLKFTQLHGEENNEYIIKLKKLKIDVIKKISIKNKYDLENTKKYPDADYILFDYKPEKNELPGGNAKSFNWNIINNFELNKPWFMSGGINLDNIDLITKYINPFGVDLSSGVEKELGIKDNQIINNFMDKLNNA